MSIFDLFGTSAQRNAAQAQIQGINTGQAQATGNINAGTQALQTNYTDALQPYLQNYAGAQRGVNQLGNVLGLNGARGGETAQQALQATPGYQFQLNAADAGVNAAAAKSGMLNSGNQNLALSTITRASPAKLFRTTSRICSLISGSHRIRPAASRESIPVSATRSRARTTRLPT
jgi:hypothetical protein